MSDDLAGGPMNVALEAPAGVARERQTGRELTMEGEGEPHVPQRTGLQRIVLTGFMGSGKTSVGLRLAQRLGWRFLDLDHEIERRDGRSVPAIFAESGEPRFRQLESAALAALLAERQIVLALGGGAPEQPANRLLLQQSSATAVVYLAAPLATLLERCRQDAARPERTARPLLAQAEARFQVRHPLYLGLAGYSIETAALDLDQTVAAIWEALGFKP